MSTKKSQIKDINAVEFKNRLLKIVSKYRFRKDFCDKTGVSEKSLSRVLNGQQKSLNSDELGLIGSRLGVNLTWLLTGKGQEGFDLVAESHEIYHTKRVDHKEDFYYFPQYDVHASAGDGAIVDSEKLLGYLAFDKMWVNNSLSAQPKDLVLIKAMGDSMEPTFNDDDLLLLDSNRTGENKSDGIYAFMMDNHLSVKRFQWLIDGGLSIISDNPSYKSITLSKPKAESIFIVGRVVWFGRKI